MNKIEFNWIDRYDRIRDMTETFNFNKNAEARVRIMQQDRLALHCDIVHKNENHLLVTLMLNVVSVYCSNVVGYQIAHCDFK